MESHSCEKTPGGGVPSPSQQCSHVDAKGAQCRMLTTRPDAELCPHHLRKLRSQRLSAGRRLLRGVGDFEVPEDVNIFLGSLLEQMALNKIDRRDAIAMAYVSQLILNSQVALERQRENEKDARFAAVFARAQAAARAQLQQSAEPKNN